MEEAGLEKRQIIKCYLKHHLDHAITTLKQHYAAGVVFFSRSDLRGRWMDENQQVTFFSPLCHWKSMARLFKSVLTDALHQNWQKCGGISKRSKKKKKKNIWQSALFSQFNGWSAKNVSLPEEKDTWWLSMLKILKVSSSSSRKEGKSIKVSSITVWWNISLPLFCGTCLDFI